MNELPERWAKATLADLTEVIKNGLVSDQNKEGNGFAVTRIETIAQGTINEKRLGYSADSSAEAIEGYRLMPGDILFSHINSPAHIGKTAVYRGHPSRLYHGMNLLLIRSNMSIICPYYLEYGLKYLRMTGIFELNAQHAVNQASINQKKLKSFELPLAPFNEQKRIADKLDHLLAVVDSCKTRLDTIPGIIKRFRQSVLAAATSGELTKDFRIDASENIQTASVEEPYSHKITAPSTWKQTTLGDVCEFVGGSQPPKSTFQSEAGTGLIRLIQIRDYKSDRYLTYIPTSLARRFCTKDDVMIGRYGPPIFQILRGLEGAYNVALMKAVPRTETLNREYLYYFLQGEQLLRFVESGSDRTAGQDGVRKELVNRYPFFLPSGNEQREIVRRIEALFDVAERLEARYQAARVQVDQLTPSLLAKAFRGELVPQDPNDESAKKLLERIRSAQAKSGTAKTAKRQPK